MRQEPVNMDPRDHCPETFGAVGDGCADDTAAVQRAIDTSAQAGTVVCLAARAYAVRTLTLTPGTGGLRGPGRICACGPEEALLCANGDGGRPFCLSDLRIEVNAARHGIHLRNVRDSVIANCHICGLHNLSRGIILHHGCTNVSIRGNRIDADTRDLESLVCLGIESPMAEGTAGYFHGDGGRIVYLPETTSDNVVEGNRISGGTHGVAIGGACRNRIVNNTINGNTHRNINICPAARYNLVSGNNLLEAGSSAVAMAYGSSHNLVSGNNIISHSTGPGGDRDSIHAYVSSTHNVITGNRILGDFRYGVYLAVDACYNTVHDNVIELTAKPDVTGDFTVGVAIENDWPERPLPEDALYSRQNFGSAHPYRWAMGHSGWNSLCGNHIVACTCGVYLAQFGDACGNCGNVIAGTVVDAADAHGLYVYADTVGRMSDNVLDCFHIHRCGEIPTVVPAGVLVRNSLPQARANDNLNARGP